MDNNVIKTLSNIENLKLNTSHDLDSIGGSLFEFDGKPPISKHLFF